MIEEDISRDGFGTRAIRYRCEDLDAWMQARIC